METEMDRNETTYGNRQSSAYEHREGPIAREVEAQTAKLPSDVWLWGALASMAASLGLQLTRSRRMATLSNFLGQWVPTLLIFGLYNKLVKVQGHDRASEQQG